MGSGFLLLLPIPSGLELCPWPAMLLSSAQIVKGWPAFMSSVIEFLLERNSVLLSAKLPSHMPRIAKYSLFFLSIPIPFETVFNLHTWSTLSHLPPPWLRSWPVYKHLQLLADVTCSCHLVTPYSSEVYSITDFLSPIYSEVISVII